jgi:putative acetyltransferase
LVEQAGMTERGTVVISEAISIPDLVAAKELFQQYAAEIGVDLCFQGFAEELAALPGKYAPPEGRLLLAKADDRIAGCVALRKLGDDVCEMKRLYVLPEFRARKAGRELALRIVREAAEIGHTTMYLDTLASMHAARRLYRSLGFEQIAPYYHNPLDGVIYMALQLSLE